MASERNQQRLERKQRLEKDLEIIKGFLLSPSIDKLAEKDNTFKDLLVLRIIKEENIPALKEIMKLYAGIDFRTGEKNYSEFITETFLNIESTGDNCYKMSSFLLKSHPEYLDMEMDDKGISKHHISNLTSIVAFYSRNNIGLSLLKSIGADFLKKDTHGFNAIFHAASSNISGGKTFKYIMKHAGSRVDINDHYGPDAQSLLHVACLFSNKSTVEYILDHPSVDTNIRNIYAETVLHKKTATDIFRKILATSFDATAKDLNGNTILHAAVANYGRPILSHPDYKKQHDLKIFTLVRKHPELIMKENELNQLPFHVACARNNIFFLMVLNNNRFDFMTPIKTTGETGLHIAIANFNLIVIRLLITLEPRLYMAQTLEGDSILHYAIKYRYTECIKYLLGFPESDRLLRIKNKSGKTALKSIPKSYLKEFNACFKK